MDATRKRRTKDQARRGWYAGHRQRRFARHMGFAAASSLAGVNAPQRFVEAEEQLLSRHGDRGQHFVLRAG